MDIQIISYNRYNIQSKRTLQVSWSFGQLQLPPTSHQVLEPVLPLAQHRGLDGKAAATGSGDPNPMLKCLSPRSVVGVGSLGLGEVEEMEKSDPYD